MRNLSGVPVKSSNYPPLFINDEYIEEDVDKANAFNLFFCKQSTVDDSQARLPNFDMNETVQILSQVTITEEDVHDHLSSLEISKSSGPDGISPRLLKSASRELSYPLATLYNTSLETGIFPSSWKIASVTPVFKKGEKELLSNYRPISLLSIIGKSMEKCIFKHFYNFLYRNHIITSFQSGFIPGDSTINQLLYITDVFGRALDAGKEVRVVFCDISRAFDRVWHEGLIYKLYEIGVRGELLEWFKNYLFNRKQKVVISGQTSEILDVKAGVPQGSILGPVLFLIYINPFTDSVPGGSDCETMASLAQ